MRKLQGLECYEGNQIKAYNKYDTYVVYVSLKCGLVVAQGHSVTENGADR